MKHYPYPRDPLVDWSQEQDEPDPDPGLNAEKQLAYLEDEEEIIRIWEWNMY